MGWFTSQPHERWLEECPTVLLVVTVCRLVIRPLKAFHSQLSLCQGFIAIRESASEIHTAACLGVNSLCIAIPPKI